jgi:hypothetical protein
VPPPDWHARRHRIGLRAARRRIDLDGFVDQIARSTGGWSGDEVVSVVDEVARLAGGSEAVVAPMVATALATASTATSTWRRSAMPVLALHDEHGGFDDLVPHLIWHG